ncbi:MAG: sugar-binding protein, partial [Candidatus Latescibacteria bacterium]|nr:sugar-binding protein [Candidatus Latescibacterota bacterium]
SYLYLAVKVTDDLYVQNSSGATIYKGDDVELQLDTNLGMDFTVSSMNNDDYQLGISAGKGSINGVKEAYLWLPQIIKGSVTNQVVIVSQGGTGVHYVETRIPWNLFGLSPFEGMRVGFALALSDNDNPAVNAWQTMVSNTPGRKTLNPTTWGELVLTM